MHKLYHGVLPKIYDISFQKFPGAHSYETRFTDNQNNFIPRISKNSGKKVFLLEGLCSGQKWNRVWKPCPMSSSANNIVIVSSHIMNRLVFTQTSLAICLLVVASVFSWSVLLSFACFFVNYVLCT